ncbi:hypothetical protein [Natronorubrum sp. A-ect3]
MYTSIALAAVLARVLAHGTFLPVRFPRFGTNEVSENRALAMRAGVQ